jgi:hypothetical protein
MKVEIRKPFLNYTKGQVVEVYDERAKAWIASRLAAPFVEPKSAADLLAKVLAPDEVLVPPKNKQAAQAMKKKVDQYYESKNNA